VFNLNLNNARSIVNNNVGFRAALPSRPDVASLRTCFPCTGDNGVLIPADSRKAGKKLNCREGV